METFFSILSAKPYAREVAYLQSDSAAYIDSEISGDSNNLKIEAKFSFQTFVQYGAIFGNYISESTNCWRLILGQYSNDPALACANSNPSGGNNNITLSAGSVHTLELSRSALVLDGVSTAPTISAGTSNAENICIFNRSLSAPNTSRDIGARIYYFKAWNGATLIRDFVPVIDWQGSPCFFDKVSKTFFRNVGSGSFTYGV